MQSFPEPDLVDFDLVEVLDVRPIIQKGKEPFGKIESTLEEISGDQTLLIVAPFDPRPLKQYVTRKGYEFSYREFETGDTWTAIYQDKSPEGSNDFSSQKMVILPLPEGELRVYDARGDTPEQINDQLEYWRNSMRAEDQLILYHQCPEEKIKLPPEFSLHQKQNEGIEGIQKLVCSLSF